MVLAHAARQRGEDDDEGEGVDEDEGGDSRLARILVGGAVRRRRLRRLVLAHLIRARGAEDDDEGEGIEDDEGGGDEDRKLLRFLVGRKAVRRRRVGRAAIARGFDD
jgi:hypothetical protein